MRLVRIDPSWHPSQVRLPILLLVLLLFILGSTTAAHFIIEYDWWKEIGQVETWLRLLAYSVGSVAAGALMAFIALSVAHAQGMRFANINRHNFPLYSRLVSVGLAGGPTRLDVACPMSIAGDNTTAHFSLHARKYQPLYFHAGGDLIVRQYGPVDSSSRLNFWSLAIAAAILAVLLALAIRR